MGNKNSDAGRI